MIKVLFGRELEDTIQNIDVYFNNTYEYDWFKDDIVKQMIKDVDNSDIVDTCVISPVLGTIPVEKLSGGVKALICLYKDDEAIINLTSCGQNCQEWLSRIASMKDITVSMTGYDLTFKDLSIHGVCLNDGSAINNSSEWTRKMCDFGEDYYNEG